MIVVASGIALLGAMQLSPIVAQPDSTVEAFLEAARAATARYHDVEAARLDGFRPVGPDFPAMGEHWVNVSLLLRERLDPAAPAILSYAPTPVGRRLVGVVYALPLGPGQRPPEGPLPAEYWHEHSGSIGEESLVLHHLRAGDDHAHGSARDAVGRDGVRLAVLHAWIWLENPDGPFVTDNWALPFFRVGLEPAPERPIEATRMLAFATGAEAYYLAAARALAGLEEAEARALAAVFRASRHRVLRLLRSLPQEGDGTLPSDRIDALSQEWNRMWEHVADALPEGAFRRLEPLRGAGALRVVRPPDRGDPVPRRRGQLATDRAPCEQRPSLLSSRSPRRIGRTRGPGLSPYPRPARMKRTPQASTSGRRILGCVDARDVCPRTGPLAIRGRIRTGDEWSPPARSPRSSRRRAPAAARRWTGCSRCCTRS